jgi:hypothetical protein
MMASKKAAMAPDKKPGNDPNVLRVPIDSATKTHDALMAEIAYDPAARSLAASRGFLKGSMGETALTESLDALVAQVKEVQGGKLAGAEKTLVAQANTLDAIFNELARRAALNMGEYLHATEMYLRLALKAQSQCRATLETLAAIKNPPIVYARQANVTTGPQQINNGTAAPTRAREIETEQTQLSGGSHELLPDARASGIESQVNPSLETVGEIDRAEIPRR